MGQLAHRNVRDLIVLGVDRRDGKVSNQQLRVWTRIYSHVPFSGSLTTLLVEAPS